VSIPWFGTKGLSGNESPRNWHGIKKTAHAEPKFVPSGTPIAVGFTLKKSTLMRALKLGEQIASIPGLTLIPGVLDGTGEDGRKSSDIRFANVVETRHWRLVIE
jgi:hypothetical protein